MFKNNRKIFIIAIVILHFFYSCKEDGKIIIPTSTGGVGQVLIIMNDSHKKGAIGDSIKAAFQEEMLVLPQVEPKYSISIVNMGNFSSIFKRYKSILLTKISTKVKKTGMNVTYNRWAKPQMVVTIVAKSEKEFIEYFSANKRQIIELFDISERNRYIAKCKKAESPIITPALAKYKIHITIPKHFKLDVDSSHFKWISYETPKLTQAILIWDYPYTDTSQLSLENLILKHDSVLLNNVPGPEDGSYMTVEKRVSVEFEKIKLDNEYAVKIRGLWDAKNAFLAGPFVSITTVDKKRNRLVTAYGFVYAGKQNKRDFMRQVEAILHTLKFTD